MGVDIRSHLNVGMSHELLGGTDINACLCEIGTEGMPETVRDEVLRKGKGWL